jgi:transposase-like protein
MKARLYALRKGMGYKVESLSKEWGISADTIRKHAKDHRALVYVEATPGEYVACVVHPETPKGE